MSTRFCPICFEKIRDRIEAAEDSLKLAESQSYPDFAISGSYNRAWMNEDLRPFIGISVNVPIQFGRLRAEKNIANTAHPVIKRIQLPTNSWVMSVRLTSSADGPARNMPFHPMQT